MKLHLFNQRTINKLTILSHYADIFLRLPVHEPGYLQNDSLFDMSALQ